MSTTDIIEDVVSLKTAKLAKKRGFNELSTHVYTIGFKSIKEDKTPRKFGNYEENDKLLQPIVLGKGQLHLALAPSQSTLQKWLREKHHLVVEPCFNESLYRRLHERAHNKKCLNYHWTIITNTDDPEHIHNKFYSDDTFETYEQALEAGLLKALNLIP